MLKIMPGSSKCNKPIGVFDSGLGGLTVVKQIIKYLPHEDIVYFGDTARVPYGTKSRASIVRFSCENTKILLKHKVKAVVVACNSSSAYALHVLHKKFDVPVIDVIEPGAGGAVAATENKRIGVIATSATVASQAYIRAIHAIDPQIKVYQQACPLFVPIIEHGWSSKGVTQTVAAEYLKSLNKAKVDTLILGCTHYPLIKNVLRKVNRNVKLIDSAQMVAKAVKDVLMQKDLISVSKRKGRPTFLVSDHPQDFKRIARGFLGEEIKNIKEVNYV